LYDYFKGGKYIRIEESPQGIISGGTNPQKKMKSRVREVVGGDIYLTEL